MIFLKSKDRNTKISDENNEFDVFVSYEESELDISSKTRRKTPNKCWEWIKKYIAPGLTLTAVLGGIGSLAGNHISQQRYYDELVGKYIASMEELLMDDKFHEHYQKKEHFAKEKIENEESKKEEAEYNQVKSIAHSIIENTLRSLSKDDGFCVPIEIKFEKPIWIPWCMCRKNPERRQFVVSFLDQAGLGFKNRVDETMPKEPLKSFLEGINLGTLTVATEGINLENINLSRAILRKADFRAANLKSANLGRSDLSEGQLNQAILQDADLILADLTRAVLRGADLTDADLTRAVLTRAVLTRAVLTGANLTGANLTGANLTGANLTDADLSPADLTDQKTNEKKKKVANLTGANLAGANLTGADLTRANLTGAKGAFLTHAKLCYTILPNGEISGCPKKDTYNL